MIPIGIILFYVDGGNMEITCPFRMRKMAPDKLECEIDYIQKKHMNGELTSYCLVGDCMYYPDSECPIFQKMNECFIRK